MSIDVGAKAPDFALSNQDHETVRLSDELKKGPVVLAFLPGAFSGTCTKELCTFRESKLTSAGCRVFGISTDTFFALKGWANHEGYDFPLLSDYNKEVIRQYGVVNPDMIGLKDIAKRAVFVVDRNGMVTYREVLEDARNEPDYDKLRAAVTAAN